MADLSGTSGNDTFVYATRGFGTDTITGFEIGKDQLDLSAFHVADVASLRPYMSQVGPDVVIKLAYGYKAEQITLTNTDLASLLAAPESFVFNTSDSPLTVLGTERADVLFGGVGADKLLGDNGNDQLNGGAGADQLTGGLGNDLLRGGAGKDVFIYDGRNFEADTIADFQIGEDRIDLSALHLAGLASLKPYMAQVGADVVITLGFGYISERITLTNTRLSALLASPASFAFNTLTDALTVEGTARADVLFGGLGADRLLGGSGDDQLNGGAGADQLIGGFGDDLLRGGAGKDVFVFDAREFDADTIADFKIGDDRIDLSFLHVADMASLKPYMKQAGADVVITLGYGYNAEQITLTNIKLSALLASPASFVFNTLADALTVEGSVRGDILFGGRGADRLTGGRGDDELNGDAGRDQLTGGAGNDVLRGGGGKDTFYFAAGDGHDSILDFSHAQGDKIDLSQIDPSTATGDQALVLVSGNVFTGAGQVRISAHDGIYTLLVNLDANTATAELTIDVHSATALVAGDLVL